MSSKKDKKDNINFTVFQEESKFRGILQFSRPLKILGELEGEIIGKNLLEIGANAKVKAQIKTTHLVVYGKVTGNALATEKVELKRGASFVGNIKTPSLEIDDGVVYEGQTEMMTVVSGKKS